MGDGHGGADAERAGGFAAEAVEGIEGFVSKACAFAGVAEEDRAGAGEADAAFAAIEERGGEFLFEGMNLLAHRGLAEVETFGRATEAGFFGDGTKDAEPEIFHGTGRPGGPPGGVLAAQRGAPYGAPAVYRVSDGASPRPAITKQRQREATL